MSNRWAFYNAVRDATRRIIDAHLIQCPKCDRHLGVGEPHTCKPKAGTDPPDAKR